jgi:hypothetical protein
MPKINLKEVELMQMDGSIKPVDMREDICKPLWLHHDEPMARLGVRLFNGECEISDDEAAEIRKIIEPWSWVARDAIEKQLAKK